MVVKSFWMLLACLFFAVMAVCVKEAAMYCTVFEIVFYRSFVGVLFTGAQMAMKDISPITQYPFRHLRRCFCGVSTLGIQCWVVTQLPLGTAQTLVCASPLFFTLYTLVAARYAKQPIEWGIVGAIVVGFVGVILIMKPDATAVVSFAALVGRFYRRLGRLVYARSFVAARA